MNKIEFTDKNGTFRIHNPENYSGLYLPLAGETGLKSSITPNLGGDSKTDQNHFLLEPVSIKIYIITAIREIFGVVLKIRAAGPSVVLRQSRKRQNLQRIRMKAY